MYGYATFAGLMLSTSMASVSSKFVKRGSWGPAFSLGPAKREIISTPTTIYPGSYPGTEQYYINSTTILDNAHETFIDTLVISTAATGDMVTADGGKICVIPAMEAAAPSSTIAAAVSTVVR